MPRKCCIYACCTNYDSQDENAKIPVYCLPKDDEERAKWIKAIPNANLTVNGDTVICALHWPQDFDKIKVRGGKLRPKDPPSMWLNIPSSQVPTPSASRRTTLRASSSVRNVQKDELEQFLAKDKVSFSTLEERLVNNKWDQFYQYSIIAFLIANVIIIQSNHYESGISMHLIKIFENLGFETYHCGVKCHIPSLSSNRITTVQSMSVLDEILRFLSSMPADNKKQIILQQVTAMGPKCIGKKLYFPEMIERSFGYFATSRALYTNLRDDFNYHP